MNTRPHCKISPPIGIVGLSNIGSTTDRWRIGFEVSRRNAACQIHKLSCWISLGAMTVEPTNSTSSNLIDVGKAPEWTFRAMTSMTRSRARAISGISAKSPSTMMAPAMPLATCTSAEPW